MSVNSMYLGACILGHLFVADVEIAVQPVDFVVVAVEFVGIAPV